VALTRDGGREAAGAGADDQDVARYGGDHRVANHS
jgi:hypothetical protein